jgi:gamma-glutamyltranspeptidase/glutathione hydrolase
MPRATRALIAAQRRALVSESQSRWLLGRSQAESQSGMVAAKTPQAAEAGVKVLRSGGNAIDAAVVTALVSAVTEPWMNGIGGGGYLLRHDSRTGETAVVAFPVISARGSTPDMYELSGTGTDSGLFGWSSVVGSANIVGHRAVSVPGEVAGLAMALELWGTRSWSSVFEPAITYASEGFPVTWHTTMEIARDLANLRKYPATEALLCPDGVIPWTADAGQPAMLRQPDLARTLRKLADEGPRSFYEGELARTIIRHLNDHGANFTEEDFSSYDARLEKPLVVDYNGHQVATMNNGSGGVTLAESLRLLQRAGSASLAHNSAEALHLLAQAFSIVFADRFSYLADPDMVDVPIERLLSDEYIESRQADLFPGRVGPVRAGSRSQLGVTHSLAPSFPDYSSGGSTTHFSVIDRDGVAVTWTQTLLSLWGSRVTVPGTGILLNNGMMWFDPEPGHPNSIGGGKRGLSNMAPALVLRDGKAVAALGASGGRKIMNCVAQIAMNVIDHALPMQEAVSAPRIDRSTGKLLVSSRHPATTIDRLRALGHDVVVKDETQFLGEFSSPACVWSGDGKQMGGVDPFYFPATAAGA